MNEMSEIMGIDDTLYVFSDIFRQKNQKQSLTRF